MKNYTDIDFINSFLLDDTEDNRLNNRLDAYNGRFTQNEFNDLINNI